MERWFMDPAQGYLPLEGWYFGGEETPRAKSFITEIRQTGTALLAVLIVTLAATASRRRRGVSNREMGHPKQSR